MGTGSPQELVKDLRRSIFVETGHLEERRHEACSSLDGPRCFSTLFGGTGNSGRTATTAALDGPGVVPDSLLHDLGVAGADDLDFVTPEYSVIDAARTEHERVAPRQGLPVLLGDDAADELRAARASAVQGVLHFQGMEPDRRLPLTFSRGLPADVVATWDGRWLVRDCATWGQGKGVRGVMELILPKPNKLLLPPPTGGSSERPDAAAGVPVAVTGLASGLEASSQSDKVSVTAELAGSVGYLRFSKPVVVQSLIARWLAPGSQAFAMIGARRGLESVWTTHLDPEQLQNSVPGGWMDLAGDMLHPVDEIAFIAAQGLELGALDVLAQEDVESPEHSVLVLTPLPPDSPLNDQQQGDHTEDDKPQGPQPAFALRFEKMTNLAAPRLVSLEEVVEKNFRLRTAPSPRVPGLPSPGALLPGFHSDRSPPAAEPHVLDPGEEVWKGAREMGQLLFRHEGLEVLVRSQLEHMPFAPSTRAAWRKASLAVANLFSGADSIPGDLEKQLSRERQDIAEAIFSWIKEGYKWGKYVPTVLPPDATDSMLKRYMAAKRGQCRFDLVTAGFLSTAREAIAMQSARPSR